MENSIVNYFADLSSGSLTSHITLFGIFITTVVSAARLRRQNTLHKYKIYQDLELASNEIFRFESDNYQKVDPFLCNTKPESYESLASFSLLNNL